MAVITTSKAEKNYSHTPYINEQVSLAVWSFSFTFDLNITQDRPKYITEENLGIVYATVRHYGFTRSGKYSQCAYGHTLYIYIKRFMSSLRI